MADYKELHDAVSHNDVKKVKSLLSMDTDFVGPTPRLNCISEAARKGCYDILCLLLEHDAAPINQQSDFYENALLQAVNGKHYECAKLLLKYDADPNLPGRIWGKTPLHRAIESKDATMVRLLLSNGANPEITDVENTTSYQCAKDLGLGYRKIRRMLRDHEKGKFVPDAKVSELTAESSPITPLNLNPSDIVGLGQPEPEVPASDSNRVVLGQFTRAVLEENRDRFIEDEALKSVATSAFREALLAEMVVGNRLLAGQEAVLESVEVTLDYEYLKGEDKPHWSLKIAIGSEELKQGFNELGGKTASPPFSDDNARLVKSAGKDEYSIKSKTGSLEAIAEAFNARLSEKVADSLSVNVEQLRQIANAEAQAQIQHRSDLGRCI